MKHTIVGGGLSGFVAAVALARRGERVTLIEKRRELGGRASSVSHAGFTFNLGPHALYRNGLTLRTLAHWGIRLTGGVPDISKDGWVFRGGERFQLPLGLAALARSPLLSAGEKLEFARAYAGLGHGGGGGNASDWLDRRVGRPRVRELFEMIFRLTSYCADMTLIPSEGLARQMEAGAAGVLYADGGWQTLVDSLAAMARDAGVEIRTGESCKDAGREVILAVPPEEVEAITGRRLAGLAPVRMACLDVALDREPEGAARFALGVDRPVYFSMHSRWARLAPAGACLVQAGYYLRTGEQVSREVLEEFCDRAMPGWRTHVVHTRFMPNLTVTYAAEGGGARPAGDLLRPDGPLVAGDWVGPDGMLADAATASGLRAAELAVAGRSRAAA